VKEYLPTLTRRQKWKNRTNPVKVNDIVLIADSNAPRNCWPMGKVMKTYPGKDGHVRVADVKTTTGTYKRPVTKLAILDVKADEEN